MDWMLAERGHHERAEQECRDVLTTRTRVLTPATLDTLTTRYEIGLEVAARGQCEHAEQAHRDLLARPAATPRSGPSQHTHH